MAKWFRRRKGNAMVMFTLMLPTVILPIVGLAIDGTMLFMVKAKLSAAVDGGAIAAARSLSAGLSFDAQKAAAVRTADQFVRANIPDGYWGSKNLTFDPPIDVQQSTTQVRRRTVEITASVEVPLLFLRILGSETTRVAARGMAARRDVRLVLVLDRSKSMEISGSMPALRSAATYFVDRFAEGRDQVGLVVYGTTAIVAFPRRDPTNPAGGSGPSDDFKSASPNIATLISKINSCCATGIANALYLAWEELKKNPLPGALNLIVLFTDGEPTALTVHANDPAENIMKLTSPKTPCTNRNEAMATLPDSQKIIAGLFTNASLPPSGASQGVYVDIQRTKHPNGGTGGADVVNWLQETYQAERDGGYEDIPGDVRTAGCAAIGDPIHGNQSIESDLARLPVRDAFGNLTTQHHNQAKEYKPGNPLDRNKPNQAYHVYLAAWGAADNAAYRIRSDTNLDPVIYTIGLGAVDDVLLRRIANVKHATNTAYEESRPSGRYVKAPSTAELGAAFESVAAEILRLAL